MSVKEHNIIALGQNVLNIEAQAIQSLANRIDENFVRACQYLLKCEGRIVVAGIGKSGHIGKKIAATLASTGTPAFFLHPAEASHGDLGMITSKDVVLALSNSGETEEILTLLPLIKRLNSPIIALTGAPQSTLAKFSDIHLDVSVPKEACPLGLAPTASTTATLAMGDALALAVLEMRGFTVQDFARSHPGGRLGRRLLLKIEDIMRKDAAIPRVFKDALLFEALFEMTHKRLGFTTIVDPKDPQHLLGIFTDGDLRRVLNKKLDVHVTSIQTVMTQNCQTVTVGMLAAEALHIMETKKILGLPVLDEHGKLIGVLDMHDLFKAGVL